VLFCALATTPGILRHLHSFINYAAHDLQATRHFIFCHCAVLFGLLQPSQAAPRISPIGLMFRVQLDTLNKQKELTPQDKLVQQDLTETLETLDKIERVKRKPLSCVRRLSRRRRRCQAVGA
jgi:potassium efflux system protein